jgi:hypothetical protein
LNSTKQKGKKPGDTLRDHESEHFELHASDLDSDEIEDLEECTDPSATRFPATDLVVNSSTPLCVSGLLPAMIIYVGLISPAGAGADGIQWMASITKMAYSSAKRSASTAIISSDFETVQLWEDNSFQSVSKIVIHLLEISIHLQLSRIGS